MGLFEKARKKAEKLGILQKATASLPYISLATAIVGVAWLMVLPMQGQFRNTYISENALLPAQAMTYFRESEWHVTRGYREEVHLLEHADEETRVATIAQWFDDVGLKTARHHWQVEHNGEIFNGTNIYGVLHAPRGDNTEAMVLVAPWTNAAGEFNDGGVTLVAALTRYLKKWSVWSKNIVFVVTTDSHLSLRSWVEAYHTSLENTAGSIEGAIVLDYSSKYDYFDAIEIFYDGLNGQQPNLDLFNTVVNIANHEHLKVIIQGVTEQIGDYHSRGITLLRGIMRQLTSGVMGPGPGSETFSGWRIDAVTLRAVGNKGPHDITTFGRIAESTLRSVNNLLEHFHQSFFFYFLMAPKKFVSIGTYLPAAMLTSNSFTLMAIYKMLTAQKSTVALTTVRPIAILALVLGASVLFGYFSLRISTADSVPFVVASGLALYSLPIVLRLLGVQIKDKVTLTYLQAYSLIFYGLCLTTIATLNFALSLVMGLVSLPLAWVQPLPEENKKPVVKRNILLLLFSSPWSGLAMLALYISTVANQPVTVAFETLVHGLLWGWRALDVWTWGVIVAIWLPAWINGVIIAFV
ncbi:GPI transamidase component Gaa1p [Trichomonascus vanleenenianus]|uniref:GPI-anchor transamidase subunit GAA1 n=1 Tax=Trichomonascus vanleenenianus TaxID=2268995 RepID=UPI003ECA1E2B